MFGRLFYLIALTAATPSLAAGARNSATASADLGLQGRSAARSSISTTQTEQAFVVTPITCEGCNLTAATIALSRPSIQRSTSGIELSATSVIFTAYSITSAYLSSGRCITVSGSSVPVEPPFTVTENASIPSSDVHSLAGYSFAEHMGFAQCFQVVATELAPVSGFTILSNGVTAPLVSAVEASNASVRTKTETPSPTSSAAVTLTVMSSTNISLSTVSNSPAAPIPKKTLSVGAQSAIATVVPVIVVIVLAVVIRLILQHRKRKLVDQSDRTGTPPDESQPYLQQKGELEAEERRRFEMQAEERVYELGDDHEISEMPTTDNNHEMSTQRTQELRGEEHSRELDGTVD